ncbi:bifunctional apoptosis regulator-like [Watersipora subatra]|uniref:bifunctional apoptosis regulator-like n=1 Tax=Watersipora subatra TaxID=2589382 RepID=UPI00355C9D21
MESEDGSGDRLDDRENGTELSCLDENKTLTPRDSTSCLSALEEELTCAICFELIVMPTSLTCGHTYCRHCLAHWCDVGKRMECPSCREKLVGLPQENVQIKSSIQKLFPEKYDYRLESTMASAENVNAIEGFEALVKKHRDEEDITAASCGFFIGVVIAIVAIATVYFMMFGFGLHHHQQCVDIEETLSLSKQELQIVGG